MIVKTRFDKAKLKKKIRESSINNIFKAAGYIRKVARRKIKKKKREVYSAVGTPPHTHQKKALKNAIVFDINESKQVAVIGPRYSIIGLSATVHEFGGKLRRKKYPKRPFMAPALRDSLPKLSKFWANSIQN